MVHFPLPCLITGGYITPLTNFSHGSQLRLRSLSKTKSGLVGHRFAVPRQEEVDVYVNQQALQALLKGTGGSFYIFEADMKST